MLLWLTLALLVAAILFAVLRMRGQAKPGLVMDAGSVPLQTAPPPEHIPTTKHYCPDTVGNDAAARPWDATNLDELKLTPMQNTPHNASESAGLFAQPDQLADRLPADFDIAACLEISRSNFLNLHQAWEQGDAGVVQNLLDPSIWQEVEQALKAGILRDWGMATNRILHLTVRVLRAEASEQAGQARVQLEFTGIQTDSSESDEQKPIHEIWEVLYRAAPPVWHITDLRVSSH